MLQATIQEMLSNYSWILLLWLFSTVCVHGGDKQPLVDFERTNCFKNRLAGIYFYKKKVADHLLCCVSFFFIMLRNHGQLCSFGRWQNVNVPHWNLCFFAWQPGLVAVCHRPYNVFLICSIKEGYPAFCRMWTCCKRNYTKRLTEREPWRSLHDTDHCFLNWNVWRDLEVQFQSHAVQLHFQTDM